MRDRERGGQGRQAGRQNYHERGKRSVRQMHRDRNTQTERRRAESGSANVT